jgi:mannose/fructose/N-acetylgalactosamine-specific phosphotransferase system component IIB
MNNLPQIEIKSFDLIGKALICRWELRQLDIINDIITEDEIKQRFAHQIAKAMIDLKLVEFTKSEDTISGTASFRARAFVLPDNQVKTLRLEKLI